MSNKNRIFGELLPLRINYRRSAGEYVVLGHYAHVCRELSEYSFPHNRKGKETLIAEIIRIDSTISTLELKELLGKYRLRAATAYELLVYGVQYPEVENSVVALGSADIIRGKQVFVAIDHFRKTFFKEAWRRLVVDSPSNCSSMGGGSELYWNMQQPFLVIHQ